MRVWTRPKEPLRGLLDEGGAVGAVADAYVKRAADRLARLDALTGRLTAILESARTGQELRADFEAIAAELAAARAAVLAAFAAQNPNIVAAVEIMARAARLLDATFWNDLLRLANPDLPEPERLAAARRLARRHFRPGTIFYPARWRRLRPLLTSWRGERDFWTAWEDLIAPLLVIAFADLRGEDKVGLTLGSAFQALRRRVRREVEVELLGRTLDTQPDEPLPPELPSRSDLLTLADIRLDAFLALARLPEDERRVLLAYALTEGAPDERAKLASALGVSPGGLRQRVRHSRQKLV